MFDRSRPDNVAQHQQQVTVPVEVTLDDGETIRGKFIVPATRSLFDVLNSTGAFIEFEPYGGERSILSKSAVKAVRLVNVPSPSLRDSSREIDTFDPHTVLGLPRSAPFEDVRGAYLKLAKAYHPDRYSGVELPAEVKTYLAGMAQRINAAYAALETQISKKAAARRAEPFYTSPARF